MDTIKKILLWNIRKKVIIFSWSLLIVLKFDSIKLLFSVQFNQEEAQNLENKANEENEKLLQSSVEMGASEDNLGEAEFKKVPRNAPCPCGSGKKFKECHGKSGPKQGILA